jgi:hypothetical protein
VTPVTVSAQDGVVYTAGSGVLEGTVRRLVLEVCATNGIPVSVTAPRLSDIDQWDGAFLTSTSRLVLPIDYVQVPEAILARAGIGHHQDDGTGSSQQRSVVHEHGVTKLPAEAGIGPMLQFSFSPVSPSTSDGSGTGSERTGVIQGRALVNRIEALVGEAVLAHSTDLAAFQ